MSQDTLDFIAFMVTMVGCAIFLFWGIAKIIRML